MTSMANRNQSDGISGFRSSRLDGLLDRSAQTGFLVGASIAMDRPNLDRFIDLAEGSAHAGFHAGFGVITRSTGVISASV